jgi:PAS domain S-box-containing protein
MSTRALSTYFTVGEAADFLGVSAATLRNWDRSGKLKPRRHPQNGYRIYLHEDLESLLRSADGTVRPYSVAPSTNWQRMGERTHFVQFYEHDDYLVESVSGYVAAAVGSNEGSIVIATHDHRVAIQRNLAQQGIDIAGAIEGGRYVVLDGRETLNKFMVDGVPDAARFHEVVGGVVAAVGQHSRRIHAFGEMVALLWADGNRQGAIALEQLWNELAKERRFALFCAYPMAGFNDSADGVPFESVCTCHSEVIPAESYNRMPTENERLRAITALQQRAQALEAEIEHRKEVEKALATRERELTDFFENASEGLHKVGPDGTILWANKAECRLLGYTPEEYIGRSIRDFHDDQQAIESILSRLKRGETLENLPARLRCKDGQIKHVLLNSSACMEEGQLRYTRCFTRDITERWLADVALREADRKKDEFLATLAHELRNPLAPLANALSVLELEKAGDENVAAMRAMMRRQVGQLTRLVDDLLDVSRITRGKINLRKEWVDLRDVVRNALEASRPFIDVAQHQLTIDLPSAPVMAHVDPARMAQVISNLLNNSAKYTDPHGKLQVSLTTREQSAVLSVRDNGVGICCEALAHVFDMFSQVDRSLDRAQGGLGIGLTLVRRLVELHHGSVNAASEGIGKGSEFTVSLPLEARSTRPQSNQNSDPAADVSKSTHARRILVVDDSHDSRDSLSRLLRKLGHHVEAAADGEQAVELAGRMLPNVILMDMGMPKLNGYDATQRIRQSAWGKDMQIVALTGWGQPQDVQRCLAAGCNAHLVKPVDFKKLERLLQTDSDQ